MEGSAARSLVPEPPVGRFRKHLDWALVAARDFDEFFAGLEKRASRPIRYRWRAIALLYFRSVGRTTPSAYAAGWSVAYNVSGSLHGSADAVSVMLFHEMFHLNDAADGHWSRPALGGMFDGIVHRCGTKLACLAPFAPNTTTVRGGTYDAFQPDNGDAGRENTAELAIRYYREHRAILRGEAPIRPAFKCGPAGGWCRIPTEDSPGAVNARAWKLLVDEFFGGVDLGADDAEDLAQRPHGTFPRHGARDSLSTAEGDLRRTPLAHLLVYAIDRR